MIKKLRKEMRIAEANSRIQITNPSSSNDEGLTREERRNKRRQEVGPYSQEYRNRFRSVQDRVQQQLPAAINVAAPAAAAPASSNVISSSLRSVSQASNNARNAPPAAPYSAPSIQPSNAIDDDDDVIFIGTSRDSQQQQQQQPNRLVAPRNFALPPPPPFLGLPSYNVTTPAAAAAAAATVPVIRRRPQNRQGNGGPTRSSASVLRQASSEHERRVHRQAQNNHQHLETAYLQQLHRLQARDFPAVFERRGHFEHLRVLLGSLDDYEQNLILADQIGSVNLGLTPDQIEARTIAYTVKEEKEKEPCTICLDDIVKDQSARRLPCLHAYHKDCIDKWLTEKKPTCPMCQMNLKESQQDNEEESELVV